MRRIQIAESVFTIINSIETSDLAKALSDSRESFSPGRREAPNIDTRLLIALNHFNNSYMQFNEIELQIADIMSLNGIALPENWSALITPPDDPSELYKATNLIRFALSHLPLIAKIIAPSYIKISTDAEFVIIKEENQEVFSVILYDNSTFPFTTDRFIALFSSLSSLYEVASSIQQTEVPPLLLQNCDSGNEKSFDFLGTAKTIQMVKEIILSMWDRIVFYREHKMSQRLELISQSLPIIDEIGQLREQEKISPEEAEILKRKVLTSVEQFMKSGAITPEMESQSKIDPVLLMTNEPKQLTEGASNDKIDS